MADIIYDLTFNGVTLSDGTGSSAHTGTLHGTLRVDYTTMTVTLESGTSALTFTGTGITPNASFTTFAISVDGSGNYVVDATSVDGTQSLHFVWGGHAPTQFKAGTNITSGSHVFNHSNPGSNIIHSVFVCFVEGTLIRTATGDVPVEKLQVGDLVVTSSGEMRPIKWLGHRRVDCRRYVNPSLVFPIRIAKDAFGPSRPSQDLMVSTGHSICVDLCGEVLIPANHLVNGSTVAQVEMDEVTYWHVELETHDVLLANNLPAESYLEMTNRGFFEEAGAKLEASDEHVRTHADFCRPVVTAGPVLEFVRERLRARAEQIGWKRSSDVELRLIADGAACGPVEMHARADGEQATFRFAASARDLRLTSNTVVPTAIGDSDPRELGVSLTELVFSDNLGGQRSVSLDDPQIRDSFHPQEAEGGAAWRWTKGELVLSRDFWDGLSGEVMLTVTRNNIAGTRRWVAPAQPRAAKPKLSLVA